MKHNQTNTNPGEPAGAGGALGNSGAAMRIWSGFKNLFKVAPPVSFGKLVRIGIIDENGDVHWFYPEKKDSQQ